MTKLIAILGCGVLVAAGPTGKPAAPAPNPDSGTSAAAAAAKLRDDAPEPVKALWPDRAKNRNLRVDALQRETMALALDLNQRRSGRLTGQDTVTRGPDGRDAYTFKDIRARDAACRVVTAKMQLLTFAQLDTKRAAIIPAAAREVTPGVIGYAVVGEFRQVVDDQTVIVDVRPTAGGGNGAAQWIWLSGTGAAKLTEQTARVGNVLPLYFTGTRQWTPATGGGERTIVAAELFDPEKYVTH